MKWFYFFVAQLIILLVVGSLVYQHQDRANLVPTPPKSLAQWYKPENKRHVWLHTMFGLRREMQAIESYALNKEAEHLPKWFDKFQKHYLSIGEMVPEWRNSVDIQALANVETGIKASDFPAILSGIEQLQRNCDSCHDNYQAVTALTYRSPDFSKMTIDDMSLKTHMNKLTKQVNEIKIAMVDDQLPKAINSLTALKIEMNKVGETCITCHKAGDKVYPSDDIKITLASLQNNLESGSLKQQGRDLGTLAVQACATCHGTHRIIYGAKQKLNHTQGFLKAYKH